MKAKEKTRARGALHDLPGSGLLKIEDVLVHVPVSRATWFRGVKAGIFPQPMRLGSLTFWYARDIRYLIEHRFKPKRRRSPPRPPRPPLKRAA